jgi:L-threonylcarbamoyladenylate synthase
VARAVVTALGEPVTAPSANMADAPPPTTAAAVLREFPAGVDLVLDAGSTAGGLPSTVLDVTVDPPVVLRAGAVAVEIGEPRGERR